MAVGTSSLMLGGALLLLVLSTTTEVHGGPSSRATPCSPLPQLCTSLRPWYVGPNDCVSTLCIDPSCRSAPGLPELALIATRLTVSNATVAKASIEHALALAKDGKARKVMRSCLELYTGAVPRLQWAARSVAAGRYSGVPEVLLDARYVSSKCTNLAGEGALPKENVEFSMMAYVAKAVVEWVQLFIG
ncbi:uncharacterized protein LOC119280746 [Triticum dicoccoides]|uniref:uncharacterized protein LOC119280746 n=1 Tax=Triticum dicoccoides TaxID=85692 RepID=UPI00188E06F8|nr:uncharacterized protein LOC119280746 [Triticum dicoccoides]